MVLSRFMVKATPLHKVDITADSGGQREGGVSQSPVWFSLTTGGRRTTTSTIVGWTTR
jgi:hypothetical protein